MVCNVEISMRTWKSNGNAIEAKQSAWWHYITNGFQLNMLLSAAVYDDDDAGAGAVPSNLYRLVS